MPVRDAGSSSYARPRSPPRLPLCSSLALGAPAVAPATSLGRWARHPRWRCGFPVELRGRIPISPSPLLAAAATTVSFPALRRGGARFGAPGGAARGWIARSKLSRACRIPVVVAVRRRCRTTQPRSVYSFWENGTCPSSGEATLAPSVSQSGGCFAKYRHIDGGLQTRCTCPYSLQFSIRSRFGQDLSQTLGM
jgi:hypothetical protein